MGDRPPSIVERKFRARRREAEAGDVLCDDVVAHGTAPNGMRYGQIARTYPLQPRRVVTAADKNF